MERKPLSVFKECITDMVKALRQNGIKPILVNLPPIHSGKYFNWITRTGLSKEKILSWLGGDIQLIYRHQELYSNVVTRIAIQTKTLLIDVRSYFLDTHNYSQLLCDDGIHPSESGHKLIYKAFCEELTWLSKQGVIA